MYINRLTVNDIINNKITQLYIRNKNILDISFLTDLLKNNTSIKLLDFSHSYIQNIIPFIEFLKVNKNLITIDFTECKIDNIEELFKYLKQTDNNILNTLDFYNCNLKCSNEFLDFIKLNKTIKNINLTFNPLINNIDFYNALKYSSIQNIYLCENNINDLNLTDISNMLNINKSIKTLYLCSNNINNINSLNDALKNNNTLIFLDLSHNKINNIDILNDILNTNNTLKKISFCDNKINNINNIENLKRIIKEKNIELNINDNPINNFYKYYIVYYKYFENAYDYYGCICNDNININFYGSDIKKIIKNNQFNKHNLISILKFNSNDNILTIYNINDDNFTCNIINKQFYNNKVLIENKFCNFYVDIEDFNDKILQYDILNDFINKNQSYKDKYFVFYIKRIFDFSENDIFKNNYSLI